MVVVHLSRWISRHVAWRTWGCLLLVMAGADRASAEVTLFGETLLPPTLLPIEFSPTSGVVAEQAQTIGSLQVNPGDYVIGGSVGSIPAALVVAVQAQSALISTIETLPSLDVHHNAGVNNNGLVRDTLIIDGQVHFVGYSWSASGNDTEATVWNGATPTGYGFLAGLPEAGEFFAAADTGAFVGRTALRPIISTAPSTMEQLPGPPSGAAMGIRADGRLILGELNSALAYWRPDGLGGWLAFENALEMPPGVLNAGRLYGAQRHLLHGEALHDSGVIIGGIWDVNTNGLVEIFDPGTTVTAATTLAGHAVFPVNSHGAPNPPQVYVLGQGTIPLIDVFGGDLTGTGLDELNTIADIFPGSAVFLGAGEAAAQGQFFIAAVAVHSPADFNNDGQVNAEDIDLFKACASGPTIPYNPAELPPACTLTPDAQGIIAADFDRDADVDQTDFAHLQASFTKP